MLCFSWSCVSDRRSADMVCLFMVVEVLVFDIGHSNQHPRVTRVVHLGCRCMRCLYFFRAGPAGGGFTERHRMMSTLLMVLRCGGQGLFTPKNCEYVWFAQRQRIWSTWVALRTNDSRRLFRAACPTRISSKVYFQGRHMQQDLVGVAVARCK